MLKAVLWIILLDKGRWLWLLVLSLSFSPMQVLHEGLADLSDLELHVLQGIQVFLEAVQGCLLQADVMVQVIPDEAFHSGLFLVDQS